jgi:hypothetical protein
MCLFLLLPGGFAALVLQGHANDANHYWTMVLAADLGAFAPLSVFQTRPPWVLETPAVLAGGSPPRVAHGAQCDDPRQHFSERSRDGRSIALAVIGPMPVAGVVLLALAVSVSTASSGVTTTRCAGGSAAGAVWVTTALLASHAGSAVYWGCRLDPLSLCEQSCFFSFSSQFPCLRGRKACRLGSWRAW